MNHLQIIQDKFIAKVLATIFPAGLPRHGAPTPY